MPRRSSKKRFSRKPNFAEWLLPQFERSAAPRLSARRLRFEWLESRQMLSGAQLVGSDFLVNSYTTGSQNYPWTASDAAGDYVVVWQSSGQNGGVEGIYARLYNANGVAQGSDFQVNPSTTAEQINPVVAMDSAGDFVVDWMSMGSPANPGSYQIYAQRYNLSGTAQGSAFQVNTYTFGVQGSSGVREGSTVAMDNNGDFVIAWDSYHDDAGVDQTSRGVYAQLYNANGNTVGSEFRVNTYTTGVQDFPEAAMDAAGDFVIAWASYGEDGSSDIYAQRYNAGGATNGSEFRVNTYTTSNIFDYQKYPAVAMDAAGDFVVTWEAYTNSTNAADIQAQLYNASGATVGTEFQINTYTTGQQFFPEAAMDQAGDFIISWESYGEDGSNEGVYAQLYSAGGATNGSEFRVNTYTTGIQDYPAVAMNAAGDFVIDWISSQIPGSFTDIYGAGYASLTPPVVTTTAAALSYDAGSGAQAVDSNVVVNDSESTTISSATVSISSGYVSPEDVLALPSNNFGISGNLSGGTLVLSGTTSVANYQAALESVTYDDTNNTPSTAARTVSFLVNDSISSSNIATRTINILVAAPMFTSVPTTTFTLDHSGTFDVTANGFPNATFSETGTLPGGVTLSSGGILTGTSAITGVFPVTITAMNGETPNATQHFVLDVNLASTTSPSGSEFQVNTYSTDHQEAPKVASDAAGDYVIVWQSYGQDGFNYGIYAQRYNASGATEGSEFRVNTYTTKSQQNPVVAMDAAGDFVVAWQSSGEDGSLYGVYAQRYNASGATQGSEFRVNTYTTDHQLFPSVAMDSAGDFVIAWGGDGASGYGVYARRYSASGAPQGADFFVNTYTTGDLVLPAFPAVAMDSVGDFAIAWQSNYEDGSGEGIYAQRYNSSGAIQGSEFRVNSYTTGNQELPAVAMDAAGDFVVTWESYGEDGGNYGVYAQRYNSSGTLQGSEFRANTYSTNVQADFRAVAVATDSAGDFVITWENYGQDGSNYGVYAQSYNASGTAQGTEFQVNTYTTRQQDLPSVAMDSAGDFVVAWQSYEDGSSYGIYARLYKLNAPAASPVVTTTAAALTYTANSGPRAIDPDVMVTDSGSADISSATVSISSDYVSGEDVLGFSTQSGISGVFSAGTLSLTGTATVANYQAALESVTYTDTQQDASTAGRTISFTVNDGTNSSNTATKTVNPQADLVTMLVFTTQPPATVAAGSGFGFSVSAEDAGGHVVSSFTGIVTVAIANNPGASTLGGKLTVTAVGGVASFSALTLNTAGSGYTLAATSGTLTAATSSPISVTPGAATQLLITSQPPSTVTAGSGFGFAVTAEDAVGNVVAGFTGGVTVAISNNPYSGTLGGTMAMNATSGVAAFTNLTLSNVGAGYTLQASSSGLTSVTTNPVAAKGIITINGTSNSNNIALTFTDASDFILAINTATPLSYPTGLALGLIYNGPSGAFSKLIFDDPFNVYSATQSFAATDLLRSAFLCDANNVGNLYIYAPTNGKSTATIAVADTAGSNNFFADATNSDYSYIADPGTSTYSELSGFGSESIAGSGGATYAYIYSTSGGKGVEQPDQTTFTSIGVTSTLSSFPQVYLVGASDGSDSATLDAAGGTFVATPGFSYVDATANGVSYLLGALYCAKVTAQASTGGGDKAIFYSYPNNQFNGTTSVTSALAGSTTNGAGAAYNFSAQAAGFATVAVFESGAGTDAAMLTSPGDGVFVEMPTVSILTVGASTITVNTYLIGNLAVPVAGAIVVTGNHDGTDSATIYDAPGNNALTASGSSATLTTSLGSVSINKFSSVTANKQNGTNDTVHIAAAIDFVLSDPGWTSD